MHTSYLKLSNCFCFNESLIIIIFVILCVEFEEENGVDLDHIGQLVSDLVMWKDVTKSTLWFGLGCICLLSSCFSQGFSFRYCNFVSNSLILILINLQLDCLIITLSCI